MSRIPFIIAMMFAAPAVVYAQPELEQIREQYVSAVGARDAAAVADLFADDAMLVSPGGTLIRGRQEIAKYFAAVFGVPEPASLAFTSTTAESENGFGSETGRFEDRVTGTTGPYVLIYRQVGSGKWRIAIEIRSQASHGAASQQ